VVAIRVAPLVLLAAFVLHPHIGGGLPDQDAVGSAAAEHTFQWGVAHLLTGVASGAMVLAFLAIRARLRGTGGDRWSARGVPLIVMGSTLYTLLPGMEFAPLAAAESGGDVVGAAEALVEWFVPVHVIGGLAFGIGVLAFACAIADSRLLAGRTLAIVIGALVVTAVARFVPVVAIQFYVQPAASLIALWPLAHHLRTTPGRPLASGPQPAAAV